MTIIEADDQLNGTKLYFETKYKLNLWLEERFGNNSLRVPYAHGFERKMVKIRGLVLSKEEILDRNLLPKWRESIAHQRKKIEKQLQKAKQLAQETALRHAEKGLSHAT